MLLKVLTLNVLSPEHADWDRRRAVLRSRLREIRADVVALQETVRVPDFDAAADLLGPEYALLHHSQRSADGVGAVLASRRPVETVREIDLRVTPRIRLPWAAAVVAVVRLPPPFGLTISCTTSRPMRWGSPGNASSRRSSRPGSSKSRSPSGTSMWC